MKKTVAIVLLAVHLFNIGGYRMFFQYMISRSDAFVEKQISKGLYNVHDLVEVKIPVHMPQIQSWTSYEPVSGQVQLHGNCYNYVKLKVTQDTLFVMCIPNYKSTRLTNANIIYADHVSDVPLNKKATTNIIKDFSFAKYNHLVLSYLLKPTYKILETPDYALSVALPVCFVRSIDQPPRISA